jgi:hypothetical protein
MCKNNHETENQRPGPKGDVDPVKRKLETVRNIFSLAKPCNCTVKYLHLGNRSDIYIYIYLLRMTDTMTSENTDLSPWDILYKVASTTPSFTYLYWMRDATINTIQDNRVFRSRFEDGNSQILKCCPFGRYLSVPH